MNVTLANIDLTEEKTVNIDISQIKVKNIRGRILTSNNITDHNTFENPHLVKPVTFEDFKIKKDGQIELKLPAKSIVVLSLD